MRGVDAAEEGNADQDQGLGRQTGDDRDHDADQHGEDEQRHLAVADPCRQQLAVGQPAVKLDAMRHAAGDAAETSAG